MEAEARLCGIYVMTWDHRNFIDPMRAQGGRARIGPNLLLNSDFTNGNTNWTLNGTLSPPVVVANQLVWAHPGVGGGVHQAIQIGPPGMELTKTYILSCFVDSYTSGSFIFRCGSGTNSVEFSGTGLKESDELVCAGNAAFYIQSNETQIFNGVIEWCALKEVRY
jgi:hypothetical protein